MARRKNNNSPVNILKEAKKKISNKDDLARINRTIKLIQGWNSGRIAAIRQW